MTAKQFLNQYRHCENMVKQKREKSQEQRAKATSLSVGTGEGVHTNTNTDAMTRAVEAYIEMEREYLEEVERLKRIQSTVLQVIDSLPNQKEQQMLSWYYISGKTLEQTAVEMNYSYMQVCRIHGHALLSVKDVIECYGQPML